MKKPITITYMILIMLIYLLFMSISKVICAEDMTGFYWEAGFSIHSVSADAPEFNGSNPLGNFGFGYSSKVRHDAYVDIYFKHTSSIPDYEKGMGLNQIGVQFRSYFNGNK